MSHALLAPSSAHRWIECPGSVVLSKDIPETTSEYAEEGTFAHAVAAHCLNNPDFELSAGFVLTYEDNGVEINRSVPEDMVEPVLTYVNTVRYMTDGATDIQFEQRIDLSDVLGIPEQFGTSDVIAIVGNELQIHDLKYGKGVKVFADKNWQLILYALGALEEALLIADIDHVRLVIHQPRLNHGSEAVYTVEELREFGEEAKLVAKTIMAALEKGCGAELNPGEKQCCFCPAKGQCEALQNFALTQVIEEFEFLPPEADLLKEDLESSISGVPQIDNSRLSVLLGNLDLISKWVSAVRELAMSKLLAGEAITGWKLVEGKAGNRKWADAVKVEEIMKSMRLKKEEMYDFKIISPTTAEKLLKGSKRKWNRLQPEIIRSAPAPIIVPESDKRPALDLTAKAEEFEVISETGVEEDSFEDLI